MKINTNALPGESDTQALGISRKTRWAGRILSTLPVLFLLMDGIMKLVKPEPVVKATVELGYPENVIMAIGVVLLGCVILYVVPRTAVLGAILLTGYLGGAIATHVRVGNPLFSHALFPVYLAVLIWGGLYLRESRLRALIPLRRDSERDSS
jgi:DoxX-like protein